ncbi:MAG: aminotransferase class I/II-fold pyridoxal phosphate-dependent enzyme, partial [Longimicrobiales bacterium]
LLGCTLDDLPGALATVALNGLNPEGYPPLVEAIAARYAVDVARVATAAGATGANFLAFAALVRPGDDVVVEWPAYDPIPGALRMLGANIRTFERAYHEGWSVDPERVRAAVTPATRAIVISSPHNPSGAVIAAAALEEIGRIAAAVGAHVVVDEVYLDAVYGDRPAPAATLGDVFVSTNSLTKAYGLSGLRSGWVIAAPDVAERVRRVRDVVDVSGAFPADRLAVVAFHNLDALEKRARAIIEPNLERLAGFIEERPELAWVRPRGGTVGFPRFLGTTDTRPLAERLLREHGTAIVPGAFFEAPPHARIAFGCAAATLEAGLLALAATLDATNERPA